MAFWATAQDTDWSAYASNPYGVEKYAEGGFNTGMFGLGDMVLGVYEHADSEWLVGMAFPTSHMAALAMYTGWVVTENMASLAEAAIRFLA